jgi:hypothetical protein
MMEPRIARKLRTAEKGAIIPRSFAAFTNFAVLFSTSVISVCSVVEFAQGDKLLTVSSTEDAETSMEPQKKRKHNVGFRPAAPLQTALTEFQRGNKILKEVVAR